MKLYSFGKYTLKVNEEKQIVEVFQGINKLATVNFEDEEFFDRTIQMLDRLEQLAMRLNTLRHAYKGT